MDQHGLYRFISAHRWAVEATMTPVGMPQAAVIGFIVTESLELFFDTSNTSRKYKNLKLSPKIALVIGWDEEQTIQYEGVADEPKGSELAFFKARYFERFPDGRARETWPDIAYLRVRPDWLRYSDFRSVPPGIEEFSGHHFTGHG